MFQVSFWCVGFPVSIPKIKWSCYPELFRCDVCDGVWSTLYLHMLLKTLFVVTRVLFRVFCLGVSISVFGLCVKYAETVLRLVILVVAVTVGPGCEQLVQFIVLVVEFSRAWGISCSFIVYLDLFFAIGTVGRIGR